MKTMKKSNKKKLIIAILCVLLMGLLIWTIWDNMALEVNEYEITSNRIPKSFNGFRIAQVSDLHNAEFGEGNCKLIELLSQTHPDIIVLTGDLIDSRHTDIQIALDFCRSAIEIAPVYYINGNHEARVREYEDLKIGMEEAGIIILEDEKVQLELEGECITLVGIQDPSFTTDYLFGDAESTAAATLSALQNESDGYTVLLSHRPELFDVYVASNIDLVFSGHAHGGQFRLPVIGGLYAPNQGILPKYDAGLFSKDNTTMIVSRGVGNSIIPIRFNNRPEIIVVTLNNII